MPDTYEKFESVRDCPNCYFYEPEQCIQCGLLSIACVSDLRRPSFKQLGRGLIEAVAYERSKERIDKT